MPIKVCLNLENAPRPKNTTTILISKILLSKKPQIALFVTTPPLFMPRIKAQVHFSHFTKSYPNLTFRQISSQLFIKIKTLNFRLLRYSQPSLKTTPTPQQTPIKPKIRRRAHPLSVIFTPSITSTKPHS